MKSHYLSIYARTALVATAVLVMTACVHGPYDHYAPAPYHSPHVTYYDYWYYPAIGSYYDTRSHVYIYFEHDRWVRARALPPHLRPHLGRHVIVRSPHNRPYEEHHRHREQYRPERYRHAVPGDRTKDIWLGAPRREPPHRDHDDRRRDDGGRGGKGEDPARDRDGDRHGDHSRGPVQRDYREQRREHHQRQPPTTRRQEAPARHQSPAGAAPVTQEQRAREREGRAQGDGQRDAQPGPQNRRALPERPYWDDRWKDD